MNLPVTIYRLMRVLMIAGMVVGLASCSTVTSRPKSSPSSIPTTTAAQRVAQAFAKISIEVEKKDGSASVWSKPILAARTSLPNGQTVAMWVADNATTGLPTRGYYLDSTSTTSKAATGASSWVQSSEEVLLERQMGSVVVGNVGSWGVSNVRVLVHGNTVDLPVTKDFFLIPSALTVNASGKFTITLLDEWGKPFGVASDMLILGGAAPTANVSAIPYPVTGLTGCAATAPYISPHQVSEGVRAAATAYYKAKNLLPITIYKNEENFLNLVQQRIGWHWCDSGGVIGGHGGQVPVSATAAVTVYVSHAPYPDNPVASNFLTIAMIPSKGWQVVGENTSP
jgi:uncharacterized protein YceK